MARALHDKQTNKLSTVGSASADGLRYESLVADEDNVNVEAAAFEAAGEIRVSESRPPPPHPEPQKNQRHTSIRESRNPTSSSV